MPVSVPALSDQLTPNQMAKRRQIIEAAKHVLVTQGLSRCSAREVATVGPLTKSAIHYYFEDMDLLIDLAMTELVAGFQERLRAAGEGSPDAVTAFWRTVDAYLDVPRPSHLWFEYWTDASRKSRLRAVSSMLDQISAVFAERLRNARVRSADEVGRTVLVYLMGAIVDQTVDRNNRARTHETIALLTGLNKKA